MMSGLNQSFDTATEIVSKARKNVAPNYGFLTQLQLYEKMGYQLEGDTEAHSEYQRIRRTSMLVDLRMKWIGRIRTKSNFNTSL